MVGNSKVLSLFYILNSYMSKKIKLIIIVLIGVLLLPYMVYFFSPVDMVVINSNYDSNYRNISIGGCFQNCMGYVSAKCQDDKYYFDNSMCYGYLIGTCVQEDEKKDNIIKFWTHTIWGK